MDQYLDLPQASQVAFVASWSDVLCLLWKTASNPSEELNREIERRLKDYYSGPNCHERGEDALPGADEDAASASIYATEAYCTGSPEAAVHAVMRLLDDTDARAIAESEMNGEDLMSAEVKAKLLKVQQVELDRLDRAILLLQQNDLTEETLERMRRALSGES